MISRRSVSFLWCALSTLKGSTVNVCVEVLSGDDRCDSLVMDQFEVELLILAFDEHPAVGHLDDLDLCESKYEPARSRRDSKDAIHVVEE